MKRKYGDPFNYEESLDREKEITRIFNGSHDHNLKTLLLLYRGHYPALAVKLQMLSISFHKETQSGRLQSKIMRDVEQIQTLSSQIFLTVLTTMLNIVVSFGVVLTRSHVIFLFYILTMPVAIFLVVVFKGKIKDYNRSFRREMEETSAKVMEMVEMVPVARAHALEKQETRKMGNQLDQIARKGLKLDMVQTYFSSIVAQISNLIALLSIISKGLESIDSVGDIICANDVEYTENKKKIDNVRGEISFRHLSFSYPKNERCVLNDLNLTIHEGETVAFVGASGSGKTTIINLAIGFLKPDSGQVLILDEATSALDSVSEKKIQDSVRRLIKGRTTLIVAHRLSTIRDADKIAVIGEGGLLEYGTWDELMARKGVFYRMRSLQA